MHRAKKSLGCFLCAATAWAQGVITTVAGQDFVFPRAPMAATAAPVGNVGGAVIDIEGHLYICDVSSSLVLKVDLKGVLTIVAGSGMGGFSGDGGPATNAALNAPRGLAIDAVGNLFIADTNNNRIRRVSRAGTITTFAGDGRAQYSGDGVSAVTASLSFPVAVAVDPAGALFIADLGNNRIRKISQDGIITTVAGNGENFTGIRDGGAATETPLFNPNGVAVDSTGALFIAGDWPIRKVDSSGVITSIPLDPGKFCSSITSGIGVNMADDLFVTNACGQVFEVSATGTVRVIAGTGGIGFGGDGGPAVDALLMRPAGVVVDGAGNVFIADTGNNRVRRVSTEGIITTVVGSGGYRFGGDGADARNAYLYFPRGVAVTSTGGLYIADTLNNRIRYVSPNGTIATVAGIGAFAFSGDGEPAINAALALPYGVAVDSAGTLFVADAANTRTRKVGASGIIDTVIGGATAVAVDRSDNLFVADVKTVYKLTPAGVASTIAGSPDPEAGFSGDGGPAIEAQLNALAGIAVDTEGNLFLADRGNNRIRRVGLDGIITTIAGNGDSGFSGDGGAATEAALSTPTGVAVDSRGNVYIADSGNNCIRVVSSAGVISRVAGTGDAGFSGDGAISTAARLNTPIGVGLDASGNLFIADSGNNRIRKVLLAPVR